MNPQFSRTSPRSSPKYKVPARVFATGEFPVTPGANATKIQKHKLREEAERLMG